MDIVPFSPEHIVRIKAQPAQIPDAMCHGMTEAHAKNLMAVGPAVTGMVGDEIIFCLGKAEIWKNRHVVWSMMSESAGKHMIGIVRAARRLIAMQAGDGRLEVMVRAEFGEGCRFAELMGFKFHHYEERFLPDGGDARIYVRYV